MGEFRVFVFVANCFIPRRVAFGTFVLYPFCGMGNLDASSLVAEFVASALGSPTAPRAAIEAEAERAKRQGASIVIETGPIKADDPNSAIRTTEGDVRHLMSALALRQVQRGSVVAFLSLRTDIEPVQFHVHVRPQHPPVRRITNLPLYATGDADEISEMMAVIAASSRVRLYLDLFAEAISHTNTLEGASFRELQLLKLWTLLETMAFDETPSEKRAKVKALFSRYHLSTLPDFAGHAGRDLIDIAYAWRNVVAHAGGAAAAVAPKDVSVCTQYSNDFDHVGAELIEATRMLIRLICRAEGAHA